MKLLKTSRPFGRPNYKIIEFYLDIAIMRVPSIPLFFPYRRFQRIIINNCYKDQ